MKKKNITKLLLSLFMAGIITFTNTAPYNYHSNNNTQIQLFSRISPYYGDEVE